MRETMTVRDVIKLLEAEVLSGEDKLDAIVQYIGASDMMSDVLAYARPGMMLITSITTSQAIRTGLVTETLGMIIAQNKTVPPQIVKMAQDNNFLLLRTRFLKFTACGRLYNAGFKGLDGE
jgi:predicted transcriptional regulator